MRSVLVIGQNGQVSTYLQRSLIGDYAVIVAGRKQLDLSKTGQIYAALEQIKPTIIINPAAYTAVDLAEQESELADTINRAAVAEIANYCADTGTPLIHFSTDYVFAGDAELAYTELDTPSPSGVYGQTKLAGENEILKTSAPALILRTSWVYSNHGKNFYKAMLNLAESRNELSVVADQLGAPTYAGSIAEATSTLVDIVLQQGGIKQHQIGVYHFTCGGQTSWCDFAKAIFASNGKTQVNVNGIRTEEYPTPAKRPAFSVLDNSKLQNVFSISLPDWQHALEHCAAETQVPS